jgi:hypothetical protein
LLAVQVRTLRPVTWREIGQGRDWTDLAGNVAGAGVRQEAHRRRQAEGAGADRSWRVGADDEGDVAELLTELTGMSWWGRLRGREAAWQVLHSVPLGDGRGRIRGDVDHLLVGPPGVVTVNTKHHRGGRVELAADEVLVNRRATDYLAKARREADRVTEFLRPALAANGQPSLAVRVPVRPLIALVGARLLVREHVPGVLVVPTGQLVHVLRSIPAALDAREAAAVFDVARRSTTWNPATPGQR